jgi:hypothetical protein
VRIPGKRHKHIRREQQNYGANNNRHSQITSKHFFYGKAWVWDWPSLALVVKKLKKLANEVKAKVGLDLLQD